MHGRRPDYFEHPGRQGRDGGPGRQRRGRGPGRHGPGGRRRTRVSRGEVRNAILVLLVDESMHGYQIMQELEDRSGGGWQPSPGSIYPTLQQLADEDLVVSEPTDGKNVFSLTEAGRTATSDLTEPPAWERFDAEGAAGMLNLRRAMFQLGAATKQIAATGTERQVDAARTILGDARKALYQILADGDD